MAYLYFVLGVIVTVVLASCHPRLPSLTRKRSSVSGHDAMTALRS